MEEEKWQELMTYLVYVCIGAIIIFFMRVYLMTIYWKWVEQLPDNVYIKSELINTWNNINK